MILKYDLKRKEELKMKKSLTILSLAIWVLGCKGVRLFKGNESGFKFSWQIETKSPSLGLCKYYEIDKIAVVPEGEIYEEFMWDCEKGSADTGPKAISSGAFEIVFQARTNEGEVLSETSPETHLFIKNQVIDLGVVNFKLEKERPKCMNEKDDDEDGFIDYNEDKDNDGFIDMPYDSGCEGWEDNDETPLHGELKVRFEFEREDGSFGPCVFGDKMEVDAIGWTVEVIEDSTSQVVARLEFDPEKKKRPDCVKYETLWLAVEHGEYTVLIDGYYYNNNKLWEGTCGSYQVPMTENEYVCQVAYIGPQNHD
jgi:hypothetical protein